MANEVIHFAQYYWSKGANLLVSQKGSLPATPDGLTRPAQTRVARSSGW